MVTLPRLVVAAPASGHGKTTVATGLMAALRRAGHRVSGHKVGPDYIDPGYHALATGRPGRNLDPHLVGEDLIEPLLLHGARGADIAVIEGVMGLYDGQIGGDGFASTAHIATLTKSPVVLVVDISHASQSIAALIQGMMTFDPHVQIAGVILNKAGSSRHADEVVRAIEPLGIPVLGVLKRQDGIVAPSRHLGLVPAAERADAASALDRLAEHIADRIDVKRIVALAQQAANLQAQPWSAHDVVQAAGHERPTIAVAGGRAFTFQYAETAELLEAAGCEIATFDPLTDTSLPAGTRGLYLGGGFPEVHALALGANTPLRHELREAINQGLPTVAECAGLLYLCRSVDQVPMVGVLDAEAQMTPRLSLAYRWATAEGDSLLATKGQIVTGHEFHRTTVTPFHGMNPAWNVDGKPVGFAAATLHASYIHTHWAGHPHLAQRFADAAHATKPLSIRAATATASRKTPAPAVAQPMSDDPLRHHGDAEVSDDLVDFAVNVYDGARPGWLDDALAASIEDIHRYPNPHTAHEAIARRHSRHISDVLATAGAAEAFSLIARLRDWRRPVIVHPQFTEPDIALQMAGHHAEHVILDAAADFVLDPALVPEDADLVMVGNPTNPTSVLHRADVLRALMRPGRVLVIDEAFMDAVPAELESLADQRLPGVVVIRSLTKLWSIPGVRTGYVLAEPEITAKLRALQSPWSVSTAAIAALTACMTEAARIEAAHRASLITRHRSVLSDGLQELAVRTVPDAAGPFVLAQPGRGMHSALRRAGYAVRRADTFPGLDESWIRIAVRSPDVTRKLLATLKIESESC